MIGTKKSNILYVIKHSENNRFSCIKILIRLHNLQKVYTFRTEY